MMPQAVVAPGVVLVQCHTCYSGLSRAGMEGGHRGGPDPC